MQLSQVFDNTILTIDFASKNSRCLKNPPHRTHLIYIYYLRPIRGIVRKNGLPTAALFIFFNMKNYMLSNKSDYRNQPGICD